eukprot:UN03883
MISCVSRAQRARDHSSGNLKCTEFVLGADKVRGGKPTQMLIWNDASWMKREKDSHDVTNVQHIFN